MKGINVSEYIADADQEKVNLRIPRLFDTRMTKSVNLLKKLLIRSKKFSFSDVVYKYSK